MDAAAFRRALERLDITQTAIAELLGRTDRSARRWAAGVPMPPEAAIIVQLLADGVVTVDDIEAAKRRARI